MPQTLRAGEQLQLQRIVERYGPAKVLEALQAHAEQRADEAKGISGCESLATDYAALAGIFDRAWYNIHEHPTAVVGW